MCCRFGGQTFIVYPLEFQANRSSPQQAAEDILILGLATCAAVCSVVPTGTSAAMNGTLAALLADGVYIGGGVLLVILIILVVLLLMRRGV
jgi:hypothetical protein